MSIQPTNAIINSDHQSNSITNQSIRLTVGGTVQASNGTYFKRPADEELFEACLKKKFAYVLACRQIGKSSLMIATAQRLEAQNIRVARIDLNRIGHNIQDAKIWYFSLLDELAYNLQIETDVEAWWDEQPYLSTFTQRFLRFFDEVVLSKISEPVVIFIDEIDMTLDLSFTDDFFAAIRVVHNDRAQYPAYKRLTFVLLGVATPDELIKDNRRTPFNIGQPILIRDFTLAECKQLSEAIEAKHPTQSQNYFNQIYAWTNGHPYLTQKLCVAVINTPSVDDPRLVDNLLNSIFLTDQGPRDDNIRFVQDRVLGDPHARKMLQIYKKILQGKKENDNKKSVAINRLKIYGLVVANRNKLSQRNKIYITIFDIDWAKRNIPPKLSRKDRIQIIIIFIFIIFIILKLLNINYTI